MDENKLQTCVNETIVYLSKSIPGTFITDIESLAHRRTSSTERKHARNRIEHEMGSLCLIAWANICSSIPNELQEKYTHIMQIIYKEIPTLSKQKIYVPTQVREEAALSTDSQL